MCYCVSLAEALCNKLTKRTLHSEVQMTTLPHVHQPQSRLGGFRRRYPMPVNFDPLGRLGPTFTDHLPLNTEELK